MNEDDLKHICLLTKEKDGGPSWVQMMNRSNDNMSYEAWRRDPEVVISLKFSALRIQSSFWKLICDCTFLNVSN